MFFFHHFNFCIFCDFLIFDFFKMFLRFFGFLDLLIFIFDVFLHFLLGEQCFFSIFLPDDPSAGPPFAGLPKISLFCSLSWHCGRSSKPRPTRSARFDSLGWAMNLPSPKVGTTFTIGFFCLFAQLTAPKISFLELP